MGSDLFYRVTVTAGSPGAGATYDLSEDLSSLTVEQSDSRPDFVRIDLADQYKVLGSALQEGMVVEVELGTDDAHSIVFRGRLYKIEQDFPKDGVPKLTVQAYDSLMKMGLRKRNRALTGTLKEVVNKVVKDYGFGKVNVSVAGEPKFGVNGIRQQDWTDLDFLRRLATMFGCVMYVKPGDTDDTFNFLDQYSVITGTAQVKLAHGRCEAGDRLLTFQASVDVGSVRLPRILSGTDIDSGKPIDATTGDQTPPPKVKDPVFDENMNEFQLHEPLRALQLQGLLRAAPAVAQKLRAERGTVERRAVPTPMSTDELVRRAKSQYSVSLQGMSAHGSCLGQKDLIAGSNVAVLDVGERFNGTWFLSKVTHVLNKEGYRNEFECRR